MRFPTTMKAIVVDRLGKWIDAKKELLDWVRKGELRLSISRRFSLSDAAGAHEFLESRRSTGKVILIPGND